MSSLSRNSAERFARRARRRRWVRLGKLLGVAGVLGAFAGAAWLLLVSDVAGVRRVEVTGAVVLDRSQVRAAVGVRPGMPLARVDTGAAAARVARLDWVARATVQRGWPHTLRVRVVERSTQVAVRDNRRYTLVDTDGVAFTQVQTRPSGVPTVVGRLSRYDRPTLRALAHVLSGLPPALAKRVERVSARSVDSVVLSLSDGRRVVWGSAERGRLKASVLRSLMTRDARVYDVSAPRAPAIRR